MEISVVEKNNIKIVVINSNQLVIKDVNSTLDLIATIIYDYDSNRIIINKEAVIEDFFILSSKLAGELLQKFVNYQIKLAIIGSFDHYTSKPLKDFIYECNKGNHIYFLNNIEDAIKKLVNK